MASKSIADYHAPLFLKVLVIASGELCSTLLKGVRQHLIVVLNNQLTVHEVRRSVGAQNVHIGTLVLELLDLS